MFSKDVLTRKVKSPREKEEKFYLARVKIFQFRSSNGERRQSSALFQYN